MEQYVISISREFGSGGRLIGKRLAERLGIPCYDRTIIQKTAEKSGLSPEFIARSEERAQSPFHLNFIHMSAGAAPLYQHGVPVNDQAFFAQSEVIRELAAAGSCIIVGRCSDYILADNPNCIKVFIHAPRSERLLRCREVYGFPEEGLEARILKADKGRSNYYNYYTGNVWGAMRRYDLTVNSALTGIDGAVSLIEAMANIRMGGTRPLSE